MEGVSLQLGYGERTNQKPHMYFNALLTQVGGIKYGAVLSCDLHRFPRTECLVDDTVLLFSVALKHLGKNIICSYTTRSCPTLFAVRLEG